jgi:AraC-like DNA-binding protein
VARSNTENISLFIDGLAVSACGLCLFELLRPGWNTVRRVVCLAVAYAVITLLCLIVPLEDMTERYLLFVVLYMAMAIAITVIFLTSNKEYVTNASFTVSQGKSLTMLGLLAVYIALWIVGNLFPAPWLNVLFKLSCIVLWLLMVEEHNRREENEMAFDEVEEQEAVVVPHTELRTNRDTNGMKDEMYETETDVIEEVVEEAPNAEEQAFHFKKQLNKVMEDGMIYRNPRLTINDVANAVGTNRTYLSAYLNSVLHTTFYDYINGYRIEYISKKLLEEEAPGKTIEEIAELSGFNSTTTFRRAFQKKTGMTPMTFRREALKG